MFCGWLPFIQYLPDKPHPFGLLVRVFSLASPRFAIAMEFYSGKSDILSNKAVDLVPRLVKSVDISTIPARPLIIFNNYTTSIALE